jgi:hypothetical protein
VNSTVWADFHNFLMRLFATKADDIFINAFFGALFLLVGAVLQVLVQRQGFNLLSLPIKRHYTMKAYDLVAKSMTYRDNIDGKNKKFDLDGDFQREISRSYQANHVVVKFYKNYVSVDTDIEGVFEENTPFKYRMRAKGIYIFGDHSTGSVMLHGNCEAANKEKWKVAILVRYGEPRVLNGYWVAQDATRLGRFTIGGIRLEEIKKAA